MTQDENAQVTAYIAKLQVEHEEKMASLRLEVVFARAEMHKMASGMNMVSRWVRTASKKRRWSNT